MLNVKREGYRTLFIYFSGALESDSQKMEGYTMLVDQNN